MKPILKTIEVEKDKGVITLSESRLQEIIDEVYNAGFADGMSSATPPLSSPSYIPYPNKINWPEWLSPFTCESSCKATKGVTNENSKN